MKGPYTARPAAANGFPSDLKTPADLRTPGGTYITRINSPRSAVLPTQQVQQLSGKKKFGLGFFEFRTPTSGRFLGQQAQAQAQAPAQWEQQTHGQEWEQGQGREQRVDERSKRRYGMYSPQTPRENQFAQYEVRTANGGWAVPPPARSEDLEKGQRKDVDERWIRPGVWLAQSRAWVSSTFFNSKTRSRPNPILIPPVVDSNPDFEAQTNVPRKDTMEKDLLAWMTVVGAWIMQFCTFGYIFTWGVYRDYYMNEFPKLHSPNKLALIGSLQFAFPFLLAFLAGKAVDANHFHWVVLPGSAFFGMSLFLLSFVDPESFMHLFLIQGVGMGLGLGMIFLPTAIVCMHHFKKRRAFITGIVLSGASAGAIVFPLVLDKFLPTKGFSGAVRITAYMVLACLVIGNSLMGMPAKLFIPKLPQVSLLVYFKERHYALAMGATFIALLTMYFPASYMEDYAVLHDVNPHLAFYALAITHIASLMGRIVMGLLADKYGSFTLLIPTTVVLAASLCTVVSVQSVKAIVIVSIFYGFSSGAWLSLLICGLASLALRPTEIGLRTGLVLSVASLGALLSGPVQLGLLSPEYIWARPVGLFGFLLFVTAGMFWYIRQLVSLKKRNRIV